MTPWQMDPVTYHHYFEKDELEKVTSCAHRDCRHNFFVRDGYMLWFWNEGKRSAAIFCSLEHYLDVVVPDPHIN